MPTGARSRTRRPWARWGMRVLVALLVAAMSVFSVSIAVREPGTPLPWADLWLYNGIMVLAAGLTTMRALSGGPRTRPWLLLSAALLLDATGGILYWADDQGLLPVTVPPLPDVAWFAYYPLAFLALLLLTQRRLSMRLGLGWLDAVVVGLGSFAVAITTLGFIVTPPPGSEATATVVNSLYLVGDLVLIALVATVVQAFNGRPPAAWWLLLAGFLTIVVADVLYVVLTADGQYTEGGWLDVMWPASAVLMGLAAWRDREAEAPAPVRRRISYLGPSIAIIAAATVLAWNPPDFLEWVALGAAFTTIVLAVVRLNLDVQESLRLTDQLRKSRIDSVTGLLNRRGLLDLDVSRPRPCSLVLMDLDSFKDVNDSMGHAAGDRLLLLVANRLRERIREDDVLVRLGGDEFAVVLWDADADEALTAAESLIRHLENPLSLDGFPLLVTACAGVVQSGHDGADLAMMLKHADTALYSAKATGPGLVRLHSGHEGTQSHERLRIRAEARAALAAGGEEFTVYYQPMVRVSDGELLCVEALIRWQHDGRVLLPSEFLPEIVRGGEMPQLTRHVLNRSLRELHENSLAVPVSVNVPPELINDWLLDEVGAALHHEGVASSLLIIEITEEALMREPDQAAQALLALRASGVRVLLDDFGTGWSGLSSLRDLVVDGLKIDHGFVSRLAIDSSAAAIVRGVSTLAADLGVLVIYEGAEDKAVMEALAQYGSGYVQGFVAARPMPIEDLRRWMRINRSMGMRLG